MAKKLEKQDILFKHPAKAGNTFAVAKRDTSGMRGTQDNYQMYIVDDSLNVVKDMGSHPSVDGAKGYARNKGIIESNSKMENTMKEAKKSINKTIIKEKVIKRLKEMIREELIKRFSKKKI